MVTSRPIPAGSPMVSASGRNPVTRRLSASAILDDRLAAEFLQILVADPLCLLSHQLVFDVVARDRIADDAARRTDCNQLEAFVDLLRVGGLADRRVLDFLAVGTGEIARGSPAEVLDDNVLEPFRLLETLVAAGKTQSECLGLALPFRDQAGRRAFGNDEQDRLQVEFGGVQFVRLA